MASPGWIKWRLGMYICCGVAIIVFVVLWVVYSACVTGGLSDDVSGIDDRTDVTK